MTDAPPRPVSRLAADVDFEQDGRQIGWLRVPHSRDDSAYGTIPVPIAVLRNGPGPTLLLCGGHHGDEYEGPIALGELIRSLDPARLTGRLIVLPAANLPAVQAGRRLSPVDGGNLSRLYPGRRDGTPSEMIAHYVDQVLLPQADAVIDLHSGGRSLRYLPCLLARTSPAPALMAAKLAAIRVSGMPLAVISSDLTEDRTLPAAAERHGIPALAAELAGGAAVTPEALALARRVLPCLLAHFGLLPLIPPGPAPRLLTVRSTLYAETDGVVEHLAALGDAVEAGAPAARIHHLDDPRQPPSEAVFATGGTVICQRALGPIQQGDCIAQVAVAWTGQ